MDIRRIVIEETQDWQLCDCPHGEKVTGVFSEWFYDAERVVHCCELTGSRELHFVGYGFAAPDATDAEREEISEWIMTGDNEAVRYIHCAAADTMPFTHWGDVAGLPQFEGEEHEDQIDMLREQFSGNPIA